MSQGAEDDGKDKRPRGRNDHDEANSFGCVFFSGCPWNGKYVTGAVSPSSPALLVSASPPRLQSVLSQRSGQRSRFRATQQMSGQRTSSRANAVDVGPFDIGPMEVTKSLAKAGLFAVLEARDDAGKSLLG